MRNYVGFRKSMLTITATEIRGGYRWVEVSCDCGTVGHWTRWTNVRNGSSSSCGCVRRKRAEGLNLTHGQSSKTASAMRKSEYDIWHGIKLRCYTPTAGSFQNYGARGITVCDRWRNSFEAFIADMGPRPSRRHSIDRIDNSAGYSPDNCRWATRVEQRNNTRTNRFVTRNGRTRTLSQWAAEHSKTVNLILDRMGRGWSLELALTEPVNGRH
jgi:hypothetical protein